MLDIYAELEELLREVEVIGMAAITDRCNDRAFCKIVGIDYTSKTIYNDIRTLLDSYITFKEGRAKQ